MVWCRVRKTYLLLVLTYMLWCSCCIHVEALHDSLKPGDSLNVSNELCSAHNNYCIFFYKQESSDLAYLQIYSKELNEIVWIANGNQSYFNTSGLNLSLDHSGVLKIESQVEKPVILYSPPPHSTNNNNIVATILDSGNFVVRQLHPNGSTKSVLWQSFDYPTDTLLPGMKLGVNHKTGHTLSLVSWVSNTHISPGSYRLEWEPKEGELNIKRRGQIIWKSGKLRHNNRFENIPEDSQLMFNYTIVSNHNEDYFIFTTLSDEATAATRVSWDLYETGQLTGMKGKYIARADMCYGYNTDGGCQKWEIPSCRHPGEAFEIRFGYPIIEGNDISNEINASYGIGDCQASCWSNCSCTGFTSYYNDGSGCIFFSRKSFESVTSVSLGQNYKVLVKKQQNRGRKKWIWIIVAIIAAALLIICPYILYLIMNKRKRVLKDKRKKIKEFEIQDLMSEISTGIKDLENDYDFKVFNHASIMEATENFSSENKLGQGGFGPVYKGIMSSGKEVAVKRLSKTSSQGIAEFKNELKLICELQHVNLVQLIGCCIHEQERILIYEFMSNKSLDFFLFDNTRSKLLNWEKRFKIIEGICQGLLYLHKYSRLKIIHRDLKASNILLDDNMNPKISDFGMARMFTPQESTANTNRIVGTYGYMSPEYVMEGTFSTKSDVYSFGVLLLEILSGRRNNSFYDAEHPLTLVGHAWELWNDGVCLQLMDSSLNGMFDHDEVERCIHIGLLCVEHYAEDRPNMSNIISMLTNKSVAIPLPRRPAFYFGKHIFKGETISKSVEPNTNSTKEISTSTEIEAM